MRVVKNVNELIGQTPMVALERLFADSPARILAKLENCNPTSIKDRAVMSMVNRAIARGEIGPDTTVIEASSGNTAIALARCGAIMGFKVRVYMSDLCSLERRKILRAYDAQVVITPGIEHTKGARARAIAYCEKHPEATFMLNQHSNGDNGLAHLSTTGPEIWEQTGGKVDAVVIGLGTCGTFDGLSQFFKEKNSDIQIIGFEPKSSPVYAGGQQGPHKIIGIGPGFVTDNFKRGRQRLDGIIQVSDEDAYHWTRLVARKEGILIGPSSGAAAWTAGQLSQMARYRDKTIVCIFYDTGERYMSTDGLFSVEGLEYEE